MRNWPENSSSMRLDKDFRLIFPLIFWTKEKSIKSFLDWNWKQKHLRNKIPTKKQNTHNPQKLATVKWNDSTVWMLSVFTNKNIINSSVYRITWKNKGTGSLKGIRALVCVLIPWPKEYFRNLIGNQSMIGDESSLESARFTPIFVPTIGAECGNWKIF